MSHRWVNIELRITIFAPVISKGMPLTSKFSHRRTSKLLLKNSDIYLKVFDDFLCLEYRYLKYSFPEQHLSWSVISMVLWDQVLPSVETVKEIWELCTSISNLEKKSKTHFNFRHLYFACVQILIYIYTYTWEANC